ncbi:hypothetical protein FF011L_01790 [Roseimaritima multifibrata]|uniref:Uncharacterized protein n=1 Tax=Roseimaritima multifibrata TaxID=1930274 RepID=A0A517M994_9BACT|nr:hypothetical protein FF011L_01790 [Roseimaritima multifibrata]
MNDTEIMEVLYRLESKIDEGLAQIIERIDAIERRRHPSPKTKEELVQTVRDFYKYRCPCCELTQILNDRGTPKEVAQYDHWISKSRNKADQMWIVCRKCNSRLEVDSEFKNRSANRFKSFQERREQNAKPLLD